MTLFYLVRHGEPQWKLNEERRVKGAQHDLVPLTDDGARYIEQHTAADARLQGAKTILTSPYTRALHTAAILSRRLDMPLTVEYDLHEWMPDLTQNYETKQELDELVRDFEAHGGMYPPGETRKWESREMITLRTRAVLERYLDEERVIVVTHGFVIRYLADLAPGHDVGHGDIVEWELNRTAPHNGT
jgi:uncharacterized phosphatase